MENTPGVPSGGVKHNVTDFVYLVNAWEEKDSFFYSEAHILQGSEEDKKKFVADLKKQKSVLKFEQKGNFILTLEKKPKYSVDWEIEEIFPTVAFTSRSAPE